MTSLAARVYETAHLTGTFTLRSGTTSNEYFDKYRFEADPALLRDIAAAMAPLVPSGIDALAGLELGGVPIATALSLETGLPARFVRKEAKTYGTCQLAEGGDVDGMRLLVVEDVVTTGGSMVDAIAAVRETGATVAAAAVIVDRGDQGAKLFADNGGPYRALLTYADLGIPAVGTE